MCYSGYMTENMVEQKETPTAGPEGAVNTSGAQASGKKAERSYEVVAVIPIELFTPNNRMLFKECLETNYKKNGCDDDSRISTASRISTHIKNFSTYEYEIYVPKSKNDKTLKDMIDKEMGCESNGEICVSNVDTMVAIPFVPEKRGEKEDSQEEENNQNWILKRFLRRLLGKKDSQKEENSSEEADIYINTGATIVIITKVETKDKKDCSKNDNLAKFLKRLGDLLNNEINNCSVNNMEELYGQKKNGGVKNNKDEKDWLVNIMYDKFFCEFYEVLNMNTKKSNNSGKDKFIRLHKEIEINYVFTYFICNGFDFHILTDTYEVDDNIKYSGDAWFLKKEKIYKLKDNVSPNVPPKDDDYNYISEKFYNEKLGTGKQAKYAEVESYSWLTDKLIPEAQIRPKDIYYIPKINGGDKHDYSSVLVKFRNRLCCFIKEEYVTDLDADDQNRIVGMQIIINSFWHRMVEFSRVMRTLCLVNYDSRETKKNGEHSGMHKMDSQVESAFVNQIHTTPTLTGQIVDINSTDQDVLTLSDLANYHSTSSAKEYFNEQKEIYFRLRADEKQMERDDSANRADRKIQVAVLILALITIPIGAIEISTADISPRLKTLAIVLIVLFLLGGIGYLVERINNFFSKFSRKLFRKNDKSDNSKAK